MQGTYVVVGINEAVTAVVVRVIDGAQPDTHAPEKFLRDLSGMGFEAATQWIGDSVLQLLLANHADVSARFPSLVAPGVQPVQRGQVAPVALDGMLRPHLAIGIGRSGRSLAIREVVGVVNDRAPQGAPEMPLKTLEALGLPYAATVLGRSSLLMLAVRFRAELTPYPDLVAPPGIVAVDAHYLENLTGKPA